MDLRSPILAMYQFPTLVIFCEGQGIATAKALLETQASEGGLNFPYREDVRMYYRVRFLSLRPSNVNAQHLILRNRPSCPTKVLEGRLPLCAPTQSEDLSPAT